MKKIVFFCAFGIMGSILLFGQQDDKLIIEKGTWLIDGSISFSDNHNRFEVEGTDDSSDQESFNFALAPKIGYTIKRNLTAGLGLEYSRTKGSAITTTENSGSSGGSSLSQSFNISPFLRTYIGLNQNLALFVQGELQYGRRWSESTDNNEPSSFTGIQNQYRGGIRPGLTYFMSNKLAIETSIGFLGYSRFDTEDSDTSSGSGSNFGLSLNSSDLFFGIAYYF